MGGPAAVDGGALASTCDETKSSRAACISLMPAALTVETIVLSLTPFVLPLWTL